MGGREDVRAVLGRRGSLRPFWAFQRNLTRFLPTSGARDSEFGVVLFHEAPGRGNDGLFKQRVQANKLPRGSQSFLEVPSQSQIGFFLEDEDRPAFHVYFSVLYGPAGLEKVNPFDLGSVDYRVVDS